jgi:RecA-family ATPase
LTRANPYSIVLTGGVHNTRVSASAEEATLEDLYQQAGKPQDLDTSAEDYHASTKVEQSNIKKRLRYFVGAVIEGKRHDSNVQTRTMLTLDVEQAKDGTHPPSPQAVVKRLQELGGSGWVYTSLSHTSDAPRYRVVLPLGKHLEPDAAALEASTRTAARKLGVENWLDAKSWTLSQPMYLPAKLKGGSFYQKLISGKAWAPAQAVKSQPADIPDERPDFMLQAIHAAGLYLRENPKHKGMHFITCPFSEMHTTESESKTVYYEAHFDGNPRAAVKCMGTGPDTDGKPHLTYAILVRWLKDNGHLTQDQQAEAGVMDDYDVFDQKADLGHMLDAEPVSRTWAIDKLAPVGKVTVVAGPGGVSKSMLMLHVLVHAAMDKEWAGFRYAQPLRSLYVSYEDDTQELHKRVNTLAAAMREQDDGIMDTLYDVNGTIRQNLRMFAADDEASAWLLLTKPDRFGQPERSPRVDWLIGYLQAKRIRLLALDPAVYTHQLEENNIADMAAYMQTLTYIAKQANCAVVVLHHMHKVAGWSAIDDINQGSLRGASSFADNARSVAVVVSMPIKDAETYGLPADHATTSKYAVLKHVKHNYSAPLETMVFERKGALLVHRPDIVKMDRTALAEAREQTKADEQERRVQQWVERVLAALTESPGASLTQLSVDLNTRTNRLKPVLEHCEAQDWVEVEDGPNRSKLHSLTKLGRSYLRTLKS